MRRLALWFSPLLLLALASAVHAQGGLNLNWDGCSDGGTVLRTFACNTNSGPPFVLYTSVIVPVDMPRFTAASTIIDVDFSGVSVPSWWQIRAGECRAGAVSMSHDPSTFATNCPDIWNGAIPISVFAVQYGIHGLANELRLNGGAAVPAGQEIPIVADGAELVTSRVAIFRGKTVGTGACTGCITGACFRFVESKLQQPDPDPNYTVTNPAYISFATWNSYYAHAFCSGAWDAARNRTWGQLKGMYR